jgi:hypothetical protein
MICQFFVWLRIERPYINPIWVGAAFDLKKATQQVELTRFYGLPDKHDK